MRRAWNLDELAGAYAAFVATYLPILAELRRDRHAEVAEEDAFLIRTLLIHDYRRLLLRDPELPDVLLSAEWPGQKARLLCKELYRRLAPASERHLDHCLVLADGTIPPRRPGLRRPLPAGRPAGGDVVVGGGEEFVGFSGSTAARIVRILPLKVQSPKTCVFRLNSNLDVALRRR